MLPVMAMDMIGFLFLEVQVFHMSCKAGLMEQAGILPTSSLERGNVQS